MSDPKTLLPKIAASPYFIKNSGRGYSQVLFKPGYPLQSAELIQLQNILNEQLKVFADHIFEDGSIMDSKGGLEYDLDCSLFAVSPNWSGTVNLDDEIEFRYGSTTVEKNKAVCVQESFQDTDFSDEHHPKYLVVQGSKSNFATGVVVEVWKKNIRLGELALNADTNSAISKAGKYCKIQASQFYTMGYFTSISNQAYVYWFDESLPINAQVGVELVWRIIDVEEDSSLFDPAENAYNENSPGADRLRLELHLSRRSLNFSENPSKWKFYALLKFENDQLIYRVKYPTYGELGETLARRTNETNGSFVVDEFKLEIQPGSSISGVHRITTPPTVVKVDENSTWIIEGTNTQYKSLLTVGNYLILGSFNSSIKNKDEAYHRLLRIEDIPGETSMIVSDIHYDDFDDQGQLVSLQNLWDSKGTNSYIELELYDESKFNYKFDEGTAYVKGWRFEKEFVSKLSDLRARKTEFMAKTVSPNSHYFHLDYNETDPFVPNNYVNTETFIDFDSLEQVDLHCTNNREFYRLTIADYMFNSWTAQNIGDELLIDDAIFVCVNLDLYELVSYTKNDPSGIPAPGFVYAMSRAGGASASFDLQKVEKETESPYNTDNPSNYNTLSYANSQANTAFDSTNSLVEFTITPGGNYSGLSQNDYVTISDSSVTYTGQVTSVVTSTSNKIEVKTLYNLLTHDALYTVEKPSEADFHTYQYNSTKIGTVRANSISANHPERFYFSHYTMNPEKEFFVFHSDGASQIQVLDLNASFASSVYKDMILSFGSQKWVITDYSSQTQTFTVDTTGNPLPTINKGDVIKLEPSFQDVRSIVKTNYPYQKAFKGNIKRATDDYPMVVTPTGTTQKFVRLINEGDGEIKSVTMDPNSYNLFRQESFTFTSFSNLFTINYTASNISDVNLGSDRTKVYAANVILDPNDTTTILYHQGESIGVTSSKIVGKICEITLENPIPTGERVIVHLEVPIETPQERKKDLIKNFVDKFDAAVDFFGTETNSHGKRTHLKDSFELKHSDVYRIRKIEVAPGKFTSGAASSYIDLTHYFDLDTGQRDEAYEHGRVDLKEHLNLPPIGAGNNNYAFQVTYDYFDPSPGHFFTVNSYTDVHYRKIPTYIDAKNQKFPLRNVIDFRHIKEPAGSVSEYNNAVDFTSEYVDLKCEYYLREQKIISIEGESSTDIDTKFFNSDTYKESNYSIRLYDIVVPAYTFECDDIEYRKKDNRRYTMNDISKLQKRIENLEDIAQLNSLELQTIQTKLVTNDGDPRYKNGMLVDMFAGFTVAEVAESHFAASIDQHAMKMYPSFKSQNLKLRPVSVTSTSPSIKRNIAFLPFSNADVHNDANSFTTDTSTLSAEFALHNGKLTLHPFSDNWYSQNVPAKPQLNEDNQYKNWTELRQAAHGTQWADWDQYIGGVETEDQTIPLQNATLSQKTGQMVNNKNNIEMIIGDRKVNTTLKYYSKEIRIGFVFESLENNSTDPYEIRIGNETPSIQEGMRLTFSYSGTGTIDNFISNNLGRTITQGTSEGIIRHILPTDNSNEYYLYVTNITSSLFSTGAISGINGSVSAVLSYADPSINSKTDNQGILCGDFTLTEKQFSINSSVDVWICAIDNSHNILRVEGSTRFHIGGLVEKTSSHSQSIRPVRKKLFTHDHRAVVPYVEDRTYKTLGSVSVPVFLHQPFIFEESLFLSQIDLKILNSDSTNKQKFALSIQPMIQETLSPSLVLPFSEQVIIVDEGYDNNLSVKFDVPIFIPGNKEYAVVLRSISSQLSFRTSSFNNNTVFYTDCFVKAGSGIPAQEAGKKLQLHFHRADFESAEYELNTKLLDSTPYYADQSRLNISSLEPLNTKCEYRWRARNFDSNIIDTHETAIVSNKTKVHEKRKIFDSSYEMNVRMSTSNPKFTPMIDLDRTSVVAIEHSINDGSLKPSLLSGSGTRTGAFTDNLRVTMKESNRSTQCSFEFDVNGNVSNLTSDPNFLVYDSAIKFEVQRWNSAGYYDPAETTDDTLTVSQPDAVNSPDTYLIQGTDYVIEKLTVTNEFDAKKTGNPDYRYYSPIVTLADDFEAKQLYVQMDTILKRSGEVLVYYRELESSQSLDQIKIKRFKIMDSKTSAANKYSNNDRSRTLEFETNRTGQRFKYFQIKVCFTTTNFVEVPIVENIRILALDN